MFKAHPDGSKIILQDIEMNIPPPGWVYDHLNGDWVFIGIHSRSHVESEQYWEREAPPKDYKKQLRAERIQQKTDPEYFDDNLEKYRIQEWNRRLNGFWFMNNGKPTYITGGHYFFLTHWRLDIGYGKFRITDMEWWYFMKNAEEDPCSFGIAEVTQRRQGKTARGCCWMYERTSRQLFAHAGIQSKTLADARDNVYSKHMLTGFKHMIDFFKPIYDTEKGNLPKSGLFFQKNNVKGAAAREYDMEEGEELSSSITFKSSETVAYDGEKLITYLGDEVGKTIEVDVNKRHQVVKLCLIESGDEPKIIGKALYTTTVEEMDSGGAKFLQLWLDSDQLKKNDNGRTKSGLYRYFLPSYRALYFDKYGYPDEERAKKFHLNERRDLESDPDALASYIRKNPFTIEEAFWVDANHCLFDAMKLQTVLEDISWKEEKDLFYRGNFSWERGVRDSRVIFTETNNGKFLVSRRMRNFLDPDQWNLFSEQGTKKKPENNKAKAGVDPYDHKIVEGKKSMGASYLYWKYDPGQPELSERFLIQYINRPQTPQIFYEDMIMMCVYCGCEILPEDNKIGLISYFEYRGYEKFLGTMDGKKPGISASGKSHEMLADELIELVNSAGEKLEFKDLVKDMLQFDLNNTQKHDATMAAGWTVVLANKLKYSKKKFTPTSEIVELTEIFPY